MQYIYIYLLYAAQHEKLAQIERDTMQLGAQISREIKEFAAMKDRIGQPYDQFCLFYDVIQRWSN